MKKLEAALKGAGEVVPYNDVVIRLLKSIFDAIGYCAIKHIDGGEISDEDPKLKACFQWLNPDPHGRNKKNPHLLEGIGREDSIPRLATLVRWRFIELQRHANQKNGLLIPSPLSVLYDALTVPEEPATRAFALATCRRLLFIRLNVFPSQEAKGSGWRVVDVDNIENELDAQRRYFDHRDNLPVASNATTELLQQFLAMKGHYCLRFGTWKKVSRSSESALRKIVQLYFDNKDLTGDIRYDGELGKAFEFRVSPLVVDRPKALDVINEIVGIPIPIRGADTILFGGLRPSNDGSLVVNVSGSAGSGKTSFALALAATLSPFGAKCYYITTEEAEEDLVARLKSLIPAYLFNLSMYKGDLNDWFEVADLRGLKPKADGDTLGGKLSKHLSAMSALINELRAERETSFGLKTAIPSVCPLLVVIDSIFGLTEGMNTDELKDLADFVDRCRELRALVVVLSGEGLPRHSRLSYMVDTLINLSYRGTDSEASKPERILQLAKTRFQLSRPGSHVFHMSGREGLRISPQLVSQLDKQDQRNLRLPDHEQVIEVLNDWSSSLRIDSKSFEVVHDAKRFLDLYAYSHILIHGHGSSGKAGIGLKLLLAPIKLKEQSRVGTEARRVLVLSFLYPPEYYLRTSRKIFKNFKSSAIECLTFSPGFLPPEDLLSEVSRRLEEAKLKGKPFTGVLLDGIHNVFLSFPILEQREMLWPTLYRLLSIHKLTIATTFTTFVVDLREKEDMPEDREIRRKGQTPLLHALVQAADFYLSVDRLSKVARGTPDCLLRVREVIGDQRLPRAVLMWDRSSGQFSVPVRQLENKRPVA